MVQFCQLSKISAYLVHNMEFLSGFEKRMASRIVRVFVR